MDRRTLLEKLAVLSAEGQAQVRRLVDSLVKRQQSQRKPDKGKDWSSEPFIGMWRDHVELTDSTVWVRTLRKCQWARRVK